MLESGQTKLKRRVSDSAELDLGETTEAKRSRYEEVIFSPAQEPTSMSTLSSANVTGKKCTEEFRFLGIGAYKNGP